MANYQFKPLDRMRTNKMHPVDPFRKVMFRRSLGETGISAPEIGMGTAALGRSGASAIPDDEALYFLGCALDMEACLIDTAPSYGHGRAERLLGQAMKGRRHEAIVIAKAGYFHDGHSNFAPEALRGSLEGTLSRLDTGFVDLLLLHNPPTEVLNQAHPAFLELEKLKKEGKVRAYGASVSGSAQIKLALEKTNSQVLQFPFNIFNQEAAAAFDAAQKKRVGLIACSPLDGGNLSGVPSGPVDMRRRVELERSLEFIAVPGVSMAQAALQFVLAHPAISSAVPGASDWHQVIGNSTACQRRLPAADLAALRAFWDKNLK
jgi:aryl-alcohol dehydrogenase-like predicted oxidoreductase